MTIFNWDEDKNRWLKRERGLSFEAVVFSIENGKLLDVIAHPNPDRYPGQRIYVIEIDNYIFIVPHVESEQGIFLKTIFPSRKYTKRYLHMEDDDETI